MKEKDIKNKINDFDNIENEIEDVTKYGEFVSSYFAWIPIQKQKQRAKELNEMTKDSDKKL